MMYNRKPITPAQLRKKLIRLIDAEKYKMVEFSGDRNPQVIEIYHKSEARRDCWQAVLDALQGDPFLLNSYDNI